LHIHIHVPGEVYRVGALAIATRNIVRPAVEQFKNLLEGLFVRPWDEYLFTMEVNERTLEVKKFVETEYKTASTTAAAIALKDTPTDGATVRDVVVAESTKKWKKTPRPSGPLDSSPTFSKKLPKGDIYQPPAYSAKQRWQGHQSKPEKAAGCPTSRRCRQRHFRRLKAIEHQEETKEEAAYIRRSKEMSNEIDATIIQRFGFVANPDQTLRHNISLLLSSTPLELLSARPSNMTWHNLCTTCKPPVKLRFLLGLGLNYCVQPRHTSTTTDREDSCSRFRRDIHLRMFFAGSANDWDPNQLFIKSDWAPDPDDIPIEFRSRVLHFLKCVKSAYHFKRGPSNLLPYQQYLLYTLRHSQDFIVLPTDKNLGPALLERETYIRRAYNDHLFDDSTYKQFTKTNVELAISSVSSSIQEFLETYSSSLSDRDAQFIQRSLTVEEPLCEFYILAKIHKEPWATRPIISQSGSLLHGLGRWVDQQLQPICAKLATYIKSSFDLKSKILPLTLPPGARLFTFDANSMYTNIDTDHAIETISTYLVASLIPNHPAIIAALDIVMQSCFFRFGDAYWHQIQGTAMGTPPAPCYATLYFGIHETFYILPTFQSRLGFYFRYIDNGLAAWIPHPDPDTDATLFNDFRTSLSYGKLTWTMTPRQLSISFLDLRITILPSGRLKTSLFEK
jgi:hypothetical protein